MYDFVYFNFCGCSWFINTFTIIYFDGTERPPALFKTSVKTFPKCPGISQFVYGWDTGLLNEYQ